ncbi:MAG: GNAT family N-acetyltransferase [Bacillota bacterium]|nr:GNAT family N-acetyltransferase [Bacillota bacterium]
MEIRPLYKNDDRLAVSHVYEKSWKSAYRGIVPEHFLESLPEGRWADAVDSLQMHSLVLLDGENIVGTSGYCASRFPDRAGWGEIVSLYLLPEYMGKGYGKALLAAAMEKLAQMGFSDVFLWVLEENIQARGFYEKQGFHASGKGMDDVIGGKKLREVEYIKSGICVEVLA